MSRAVLFVAVAAALSACTTYDYSKEREPKVDSMAVEAARREAENRCASRDVSRSGVGDGTSASDWRCDRPGRRD